LLAISVSSVAAAPVGTKESNVVKYAKSWVGVRNVHGGNSRAGIDCSHLVYQVYLKAGVKGISFMKIPGIKKNKYYTRIASPRPGDLVLWKKDVTKKRQEILPRCTCGSLHRQWSVCTHIQRQKKSSDR